MAGSVHTCIGQESAPVGVAAHLDSRDRVLSTYRGHGWAFAKGVPLEGIFAELLGRVTGVNGGRGGSAYLTAPEYGFVGENSIVAAGLPIANGVAMGLAARGEGGVAVASFGDGATNQGGAHEAFVFALARNLPVLFVCENNSWSEMTPITDTVPRAELFKRAAGYGLPASRVEGSDVAEVSAAALEALSRIRAGGGPEFLEITVPRLLGHYNGDIQQYRSEQDKEEHKGRDPITTSCPSCSRTAFSVARSSTRFARTLKRRFSRLSQPPSQHHFRMFRPCATLSLAESAGTTKGELPTDGKELAYGLAVNRALMTELEARDNMVLFGEDIAIPGGSFGVTRNLRKSFGDASSTPRSLKPRSWAQRSGAVWRAYGPWSKSCGRTSSSLPSTRS